MITTEKWHGTAGGYSNHRCRCDRCRKAWAVEVAASKNRRAARPIPPRVHGTQNGYGNYKCRCPECTRAWSTRNRKTDRPYVPQAERRRQTAERQARREQRRAQRQSFDSHYTVDESGCWLWNRPALTWKGEVARRYSYRVNNGDIPERRRISVSCGQRECVNPAHLYVAERFVRVPTGRKNVNFDTEGLCGNGHPLTAGNVRVRKYDGRRECVQCNRDRCDRYRERKRLAAG